MQFAFPDMFAPMVATLLVCAVIAVVGIVVGFIGVRTGPPTEQGLRAMLSTLGTILLAVVTAAILNPVLGNAQLGKLESEQRAWVKSQYSIELNDGQFAALRFPGMDPGPGTVTFGETEVSQWGKPVTVKLVSEDSLFSVVGSNDLPLPTEAPTSDTPASEEP
jgi:hypothetical protein